MGLSGCGLDPPKIKDGLLDTSVAALPPPLNVNPTAAGAGAGAAGGVLLAAGTPKVNIPALFSAGGVLGGALNENALGAGEDCFSSGLFPNENGLLEKTGFGASTAVEAKGFAASVLGVSCAGGPNVKGEGDGVGLGASNGLVDLGASVLNSVLGFDASAPKRFALGASVVPNREGAEEGAGTALGAELPPKSELLAAGKVRSAAGLLNVNADGAAEEVVASVVSLFPKNDGTLVVEANALAASPPKRLGVDFSAVFSAVFLPSPSQKGFSLSLTGSLGGAGLDDSPASGLNNDPASGLNENVDAAEVVVDGTLASGLNENADAVVVAGGPSASDLNENADVAVDATSGLAGTSD